MEHTLLCARPTEGCTARFNDRVLVAKVVYRFRGAYFGSRVYDTIIPRTVRLSEAPGYGKPISLYDPTSKGAMAYRWLAEEVVERPVEDSPLDAESVTPAKVFIDDPADADDPARGGDDS